MSLAQAGDEGGWGGSWFEDMPICAIWLHDGISYKLYEINCWDGGDEDCEEEGCPI